jgi:DNA-binding NtrC family response regulator
MKLPTIVVIDQEQENLDLIKAVLDPLRYNVRTFANAFVALEYMEPHGAEILLTDLLMPELDGLKILSMVQQRWPRCKVIIFTAYGGVVDAVRAIKAGATDFLTKPLNRDSIPAMVEQTLALQAKRAEAQTADQSAKPAPLINSLANAIALANTVAGTDSTVLITGETGVGKEILADYIWANSARRDRPYIKVDCAAIPEALVESELFGHESGAFPGANKQHLGRFERAQRGTIFLDEVGNLSANMQSKLLRVLQTHEIERVGGSGPIKIDFRLICSTRYDLADLLAADRFREDLYYRINTFPITVPPLRDRQNEIPEFTQYFLARSREELGREPMEVDPEALELMRTYPWPGNVRELEHCLERACLMAKHETLQKGDLWWLATPIPHTAAASQIGPALSAHGNGEAHTALPQMPGLSPLENAERVALKQTLDQYNWSFTQTASALGISRSTLYLKARKYAITRLRRAPESA